MGSSFPSSASFLVARHSWWHTNTRVFFFFYFLVFAGRGNTLNEDFSSLTIDNISTRYF